MEDEEDLGFFTSKCCRASFESILTDGGKLELRCMKCGEVCGILEEKYDIKPSLCKF